MNKLAKGNVDEGEGTFQLSYGSRPERLVITDWKFTSLPGKVPDDHTSRDRPKRFGSVADQRLQCPHGDIHTMVAQS